MVPLNSRTDAQETLDTLYTLQSNEQSLLEWQRTRLTDKSTTSIEPMRTFLDRVGCDVCMWNFARASLTRFRAD
jgi:hypothetical protein